MMGILGGNTLATGPGEAFREGVLGAPLQVGAGHAFRSGVLGAPMQAGAGHAYRSGVLGAPMQTGEGHSFREGSLGSTARYSRPLLGLGALPITTDFMLGGALAIGAVWFFMGRDQK